MAGSHRTCEICGVKEIHCAETRFFARFPLDINRCKKWVRVVGNEELAYMPIHKLHDLKHVCENHFAKRDFTKVKTRKRLKKRAIPKLNITTAPLSDDIIAEFLRLNADVDASSLKRSTVQASTTTPPAVPSTSGLGLENLAIPTPEAIIQPKMNEIKRKLAYDESIVVVSPPKRSKVEAPPAIPSTSGLENLAIPKPEAVIQPKMKEIKRKLAYDESMVVVSPAKRSKVEAPPAIPSTSGLENLRKEESSGDHTYASKLTDASLKEECSVSGDHKYASKPTDASLKEEGNLSADHTYASKPINASLLELPKDDVVTPEAMIITNPSEKGKEKGPENKPTKRKLSDNENTEATPRKRKLISQLKKTKCTLASLRKSANLIENLASPVLKEFVLSALKNQKRKPKGQRWTTKNKISALAIFKRSPKAYRYMQHIMPLPSIKTLNRILKKVPMEPGLNVAVINHLKKVSGKFSDKDKYCCLAFDEISLKQRLVYNVATDKVEGYVDYGNERKPEMADHALVFMLQGIGKKMKQPLAFYFVKGTVSSEKLALTIKDLITEVSSTGFNILATVCDQGPTNMGALKLLKEWNRGGDNYFEIENKKIYTIYDVPHLFKSVRNNFLNYGQIKIEGQTGQWSHIVEVEEQNRNFLYLSKITQNHVKPKYRAKMRVKLAAQVLSQTVAAVLKLLARSVENQNRSEQILQTALLVEDLNRLFDFTNGPASAEDIKKGIRENVSAKTEHLTVWTEYRKKLETLKFIGKDGNEAKNVKCVHGYIMTLKSLRDIWNKLKEAGYKYLNLRNLNQDALENLFGLIRQHSPTNKHPTCSMFMAALKTSVISGMTAPHSESSNCQKDTQLLMTDFHDLIFGDENEEKHTKSDENETTEVAAEEEDKEQEHPVLSLPEDDDDEEIGADLANVSGQPLVYVSGYMAAVLLKKSSCQNCKEIMSVVDPGENPLYDLIKLREWWQDKQCLTYPSLLLCRTIEKGLNTFQEEVIPRLHHLNICQWTTTVFYTNCNTSWLCNQHMHEMSRLMFLKLALLLIRRQCQIINLKNAQKEEDLADSYKKGQQYGVAK